VNTKSHTQIGFVAAVIQKLQDYKQLIKLNLSLMVVLSSVIGYWVAPNVGFEPLNMFILFIGGLLVTGAANACNEVWEQDTDALMKRTSNRPLPSGRMSCTEAVSFAVLSLALGLALLWWKFNLLCAFISLVSFVLYVLAYTPLKKVSPINVFVGAIPGALPALIGWSAATGTVSLGGWSLFALQFLWQFPHFWSIAWLAHDEYKKAGMKMLPTNTKDNNTTSLQCVQYTIVLMAFSIMPFLTHITNWRASALIALAGAGFLYKAIQFYKTNQDAQARQLMFASFIYLPAVYIALIIDKL
jgi:protoheme IX farnesyltransferase